MGSTSRHFLCFVPEDIAKMASPCFTMISFHNQQHICKKKRGVAKNLLLGVRDAVHQQQVDLVAGNFIGGQRCSVHHQY